MDGMFDGVLSPTHDAYKPYTERRLSPSNLLRTCGHDSSDERQFRSNPLSTVATKLAHPLGGLQRRFEGDRRFKIRSFIQPGEPKGPFV
jgi:hypothetical protein